MKELRDKIRSYFNIFNEKSCSVHSHITFAWRNTCDVFSPCRSDPIILTAAIAKGLACG